ncbi:MAG: response regulator [Flavobacteriales bacterium]
MTEKGLHIYLVDDNEIDTTVNARLIELLGITSHISTFRSGIDFIATMREKFEELSQGDHLVLLDILMPEMSGFECLENLEQILTGKKHHLVVCMLSGALDRSEIKAAEDHPLVYRVLEKPLDVYEFNRVLKSRFSS